MMGLALIGRGGPRPGRFAGIALAAICLAAAAAPAAHAAAPANDDFAAAQVVTGTDATVNGTLADATKETGEPNHNGSTGGHSVWYRWVAPADGVATISRGGNSYRNVAVYTGNAVDALTPVASNRPDANLFDDPHFRATAGTEYMIAVDSYLDDPAYVGDFTLTLSLVDPPANDDLGDGVVETGTDWSATGSNTGATVEPGEVFGYVGAPYYSSSGWTAAQTVWYTWTAPSTGAATIDTAGSSVNTLLSVYTGDSPSGLVPVVGNDDGPGRTDGSSIVKFRAIAGATYHIQVDNERRSPGGDFKVALELGPLPPNDAFADATDLGSADTAGADGRNDAASKEPGEPQVTGPYWAQPSGGTVWYTWTAPKSGSLTIKGTATFTMAMAVFTGDTVTGLTRVANQPQTYAAGAQTIRIRVEAGVTYHIAVDSLYTQGDFSLALNRIDSPANDDFANASVLTGADAEADGTNVGATQEPCEPQHEQNYYDPSVWYSWTAPTTGGVTVETSGDLDAAMGIYTGASVCELSRVSISRSGSKRRFRAVAGVTYQIAVDGHWAAQDSFHLALHEIAPPANDMFAAAQPLLTSDIPVAGDNIGATAEGGEPNPGGTAGASVWYSWTATADGRAKLHFTSTDFAGSVSVYTGDAVDSLTSVPANCDYYTRDVDFEVKAGTTYRIAIHGGYGTWRGPFAFTFDLAEAPPNDDYADATELTGQSAQVSGTTKGASKEDGEPGDYPYASVWYRWTAPEDGNATVEAPGSDYYPTVCVFTGSSFADSKRVACGYHSARFRAHAGETYSISVDTTSSESQVDFTLTLAESAAPAGDYFDQAVPLEGAHDSAAGSNATATSETGDPTYVYGYARSGHSLWYRWVAPADGKTTVTTSGSDFDTLLGAYTGTLGNLTSVAENDDADSPETYSSVTFQATAGTTYHFLLDGKSWGTPSSGNAKIELTQDGATPPDDPVDPPKPPDPPKPAGPLTVRASVVPKPLANVLARGLLVTGGCNRACTITYRVSYRKHVLGTATQAGGRLKRIPLQLSDLDKASLRGAKSAAFTLRATARAGTRSTYTRVQTVVRR